MKSFTLLSMSSKMSLKNASLVKQEKMTTVGQTEYYRDTGRYARNSHSSCQGISTLLDLVLSTTQSFISFYIYSVSEDLR
jgi:hypothetical protein